MSGHSKWSQIKRQKGQNDQKRGQIFTKLANAIIIAIKTNGGITNPDDNFKLRLLMEKAKAVNMPKENIERALRKAQGEPSGGLEEIIYEGFGPLGIAVLISAATDNRQRTVQEIKNLFEKMGGNLGSPGATSYLFQNLGQITVKKNGQTVEQIMDQAIEAGAFDLEELGDEVIIYTKPADLHKVSEKLKTLGFLIVESELSFKPNSTIPISNLANAQKILNFMDQIEDQESVQHVFANFKISDEIIKQLS